MKRWIFVVFLVVVLLALIAWRLQENKAAASAQAKQRQLRITAPAVVSVQPAQVHEIVHTFESVGTVEAPLDIKLATKVAGRILDLRAQPGDHVAAGEILVRIDPSEVQAQVQQQQAAVDEARYRLAQAQVTENPANVQVTTQIAQQQAGVGTAKANANQVEQNYSQQVAAADATVVDAQGRVDSASAAISNAQAQIRSAQANLADAEAQYRRVHSLVQQGALAAATEDTSLAALKVQQSNVEVARGQLNAATAAYHSAVAQRESARRQAAIVRTKGLADIQTARAQAVQAQAALRYAQSNTAQRPAYRQNLAALRSAVAVAQGSLESARTLYSDTELRSPVEGLVTARYMDPGTVASAGQTILAVRYVRTVWVTVPVQEEVVRKIHMGQLARVTFDALPGRQFVGKVSQVPPSADPTSRQFPVRISLDNAQEMIRPGTFARISIVTDRWPNVVTVPPEALQNGGGGQAVFVVDEHSTVHRVPVVPGARDPERVAIPEGLQPGQRVVTVTARPLKDGQTVRIGGAGPHKAGKGEAKR